MSKYTEQGVVLLKKETEQLTSEVHSLIEKKQQLLDEIATETSKKRTFLNSFENLLAARLSWFQSEHARTESELLENVESIRRTEAVLKTLRWAVRNYTPPEEKPTLANSVIERLRNELESYSSKWETEEDRLTKARLTRAELEKLTADKQVELDALVSQGNSIREELALVESALQNKEQRLNKLAAEDEETIHELDALMVEHVQRLKQEAAAVEERVSRAQEERGRVQGLLQTLKTELGSLEIPKPDFAFERQVAAELTKQIDDITLQQQDEFNELARLEALRESTERYVEQLITSKEQLVGEAEKLRVARDVAQKQLATITKELEFKTRYAEDLAVELDNLRAAITDAGLEKQVAEAALAHSQQKAGRVAEDLEKVVAEKRKIEVELRAMDDERSALEPELERLRSEIFLGNDKNGKLGQEYIRMQERIGLIRRRERDATEMHKRLSPDYARFLSDKTCKKCGNVN